MNEQTKWILVAKYNSTSNTPNYKVSVSFLLTSWTFCRVYFLLYLKKKGKEIYVLDASQIQMSAFLFTWRKQWLNYSSFFFSPRQALFFSLHILKSASPAHRQLMCWFSIVSDLLFLSFSINPTTFQCFNSTHNFYHISQPNLLSSTCHDSF